MNKKNKQLVPICFIAAVLIFAVIVFTISRSKLEEYSEIKAQLLKNSIEEKNLEEHVNKLEVAQKEEELKLKSLKSIYESNLDSSDETLGVFGNMFEEIIKGAQKNGLMIRSVEYDMRPQYDPIYMSASDKYNACELKFFFVGTYGQLQSFLADLNNNFSYLVYLSNLNVTVFDENPDYLLINMSVNLYSKKLEK